QTADGGFILAGFARSYDGDITGHHDCLDYNYGCDDYWIVKLDAQGNLVWQKCFGGGDLEEAYSIQQISDGGFIVIGQTESADGDVTGHHGGLVGFNNDYW